MFGRRSGQKKEIGGFFLTHGTGLIWVGRKGGYRVYIYLYIGYIYNDTEIGEGEQRGALGKSPSFIQKENYPKKRRIFGKIVEFTRFILGFKTSE